MMIKIDFKSPSEPMLFFKSFYDKAIVEGEKFPEACAISSIDKFSSEVDSRFVNIKYVFDDSLVFFSNYDSPKSIQFQSHNIVSALFFWSSIYVQIRMKAKIIKTDEAFSDEHFYKRSDSKNILAIVSEQSKEIDSYQSIVKKYENFKNMGNKITRPKNWGGYKIKPFYIEFWKGHDSRINKREVFYMESNHDWRKKILQP